MDNPFPRLASLERRFEELLRRLFADEQQFTAALQSVMKNWGAAAAMAQTNGSRLVPAFAPGGGIAAGSPTSPTAATVTLAYADPATGNLLPGTVTQDALNPNNQTFGAGALLYLFQFMGFTYIAGGDC